MKRLWFSCMKVEERQETLAEFKGGERVGRSGGEA